MIGTYAITITVDAPSTPAWFTIGLFGSMALAAAIAAFMIWGFKNR